MVKNKETQWIVRWVFLLFGEVYFEDAVGLDGEARDGVLVAA